MKDYFYRAFEERYYAPSDVIKSLRRQYIPYISPLIDIYPKSATFDIGCGRGEWLELMNESGFSPYGVDLDDGMLNACMEKKLPAEQGDAISYLAGLPNETQSIVSAFHVVEHISFEQLQGMIKDALRVLKPGGLLIMETPNPENIAVATRNFYLDPTHKKPIPPLLLSFLAEYYGFARVKIIRLQEDKELQEKENITISDIINGVSPDYAVICQKMADTSIMSSFDIIFSREYGLTLSQLCEQYERRINKKELIIDELLSKNEQMKIEIREKLEKNQVEYRTQIERLESSIGELKFNYIKQMDSIYASSSWRITKPLRFFSAKAKCLLIKVRPHFLKMKFLIKIYLKPTIRRLIAFIEKNHSLKSFVAFWVKQNSWLENRLRRMIYFMRIEKSHSSKYENMAFTSDDYDSSLSVNTPKIVLDYYKKLTK